MPTASRYKSVTNTTGAALTVAGVPTGDGSDRSTRVIKRTLAAIDCGTEAGKTRHALGCIVDVLQTGPNIGGTAQPAINILNLSGAAWKLVPAAAGRPITYRRLDNHVDALAAHIANIQYFFYPSDNTIRVYDGGNDVSTILATGDYIEVELTFGPN